ncbi:hypothetical protein YQE_10608, partial [Dendroctonus ponderosae]
MGLANPAVHFFRGLRHRNLSAIRHATQRGLHQLQQLNAHTEAGDPHARRVHGQTSLGVQGFRTNPKDPESHILFFDIEALIIELLSEEYAMMSPGSLEAAGLISQAEYLKVAALTQSASPDAHKKIAGILAKMKEGAESVQTKIQAKAELVLKGTDINRAVDVRARSVNGPEEAIEHAACHHCVIDQRFSSATENICCEY